MPGDGDAELDHAVVVVDDGEAVRALRLHRTNPAPRASAAM
jgi:hypothetical protein